MRKTLFLLLFMVLTIGAVFGQPLAVVAARPSQIDISAATSESALLMTVSGYTSDDARYRLYNGSNQYNPWNTATSSYVTSTSYLNGPQIPGTPTTSSTWWIPFQRGNNIATTASYRDRLGPAYNANIQTIALPPATSITTAVSIINADVTFTTWTDYTQKYVILGYDSAVGGNLISATSTALTTGAFSLKVENGTTIQRIEVRGLLNNLIESVTGSWGSGTSTPTIFVTGTLASFSTSIGTPSASQFYALRGMDLSSNIVITPPAGFEISVDGGANYAPNASVLSSYNSSVYVRMTGASAGSFNGNITHTSTGATQVDQPVSGTVTAPTPTIVLTPATLTGFTYVEGSGPSPTQTFTASGTNLTADISIAASTDYEISLTQASGYTSPLTLSPTSGTITATTIYVRLKAGLAVASYNTETIAATSTGATTQNVTCSGSVTAVPAALPLIDNFTGTVGTLLTANGWTNHNGTSNYIPISATDLNYPGYLGTGGGSASLIASGEDVNRAFTTQTSGDVFYACLVNTSVAQTGDYIAHFGSAILGNTYFGRLYIKKDPASDAVFFGVSKTSTDTAVYDTVPYAYNSTVLVIVRYSIVPGTTNDVISMWINPTLGSSAPTPTLNITPATADPTDIGRIALRQGGSTSGPTALVDGIRVSTNWADVGGTGSGNIAPTITNIIKTPAADIESTDTVQVTATVSDPDGTVSSVRLFWGTSSGNLSNAIDMSNSGGNNYQTFENIPAQDNGTTVFFNIYAVDNSLGETYSAEQTYLVRDPAMTTIPYSQTFTGSLGDTYTYSAQGINSWYLNITTDNAAMNGYNSPLEEDWLILPGVNFNNYTNERMTFNTMATFGSVDAENYLKLMYSTNYHGTKNPGLATWTEIPFTSPTPVASGAVDTPSGVLDLSGIVGTNVYLAFKYSSSTAPTRWEVDDISIYLSNTVLTVTPETLTGFTYPLGSGPSAEQTFTVAGNDLTNNVVITAPTNYEFSLTTGAGFTSSITLTPTSGVVPTTTIHVRMMAGLAIGTYNAEAITVASTGATGHSVLCSGEVTAPPAPVAPVANAATGVTDTGFTASWNSVTNATGYFLDVYTEGASTTTDLIISEYVEGLSNKKAIELFNGTGAAIDLANYSLKKQVNGAGAFSGDLTLTGTLPNNETYVIALTGTSGTFITGDFVDLMTTNTVISFNGNDAVALYHSGTQIDVVGIVDQVAVWGENVTLVRKSSILSPTTTYSIADWDSYAVDTLEHLGTHAVGTITYVGTYNNLNVNNVTSYAVTGLTGGITYKYVVRAYNAYGTSGDSNIISVTTTGGGPLDTPVVTISRSGDNVTLNWNAITGANGGYRIEADTNPYGSFAETYTVASGVLTWSQTSAEKKFYRVVALP